LEKLIWEAVHWLTWIKTVRVANIESLAKTDKAIIKKKDEQAILFFEILQRHFSFDWLRETVN
jgi:hypothetical protein